MTKTFLDKGLMAPAYFEKYQVVSIKYQDFLDNRLTAQYFFNFRTSRQKTFRLIFNLKLHICTAKRVTYCLHDSHTEIINNIFIKK